MNPSDIQNTEEALLLQSCARLYYNKATCLDVLFWIINIVLPALMVIFPFNPTLIWLIVLNFVLSILSDTCIKKWTEKGADLKLLFDKVVFNFKYSEPIKNKLVYDAKKNQRSHQSFFSKQMRKDGSDGGVKSWYNNLNSNLTVSDQYKESQIETSDYDDKIRKLVLFVFTVASLLILWFIVSKDLTVNEMLTLLFLTCASLTRKMIQILTELKKEKELLKEIDGYLCISDINSSETLELLKLEDEKRRILLPFKGLIYPFIHGRIMKIWSSK